MQGPLVKKRPGLNILSFGGAVSVAERGGGRRNEYKETCDKEKNDQPWKKKRNWRESSGKNCATLGGGLRDRKLRRKSCRGRGEGGTAQVRFMISLKLRVPSRILHREGKKSKGKFERGKSSSGRPALEKAQVGESKTRAKRRREL